MCICLRIAIFYSIKKIPATLSVNNLNKMKKKLYIGCSLTLLPPDKKDAFLKMISEVKKELNKSFEILEFKGLDDLLTDRPLSPQEIYKYDLKECVMKADCMLAICDY